MSELLTTLTVTAVAPFMFNTNVGFNQTDNLFQANKPEVVAVQKLEPKDTVKETPKEEPVKKEKPKKVIYTVKEGDNLSVIADKYQTSWIRIWEKNKKLKHQDQLSVGDKLVIPQKDEKLKNRKPVSPSTPSVSGYTSKVVSNTTQAPTTSYRASRSVSGQPNAYAYGWCTWWVKEKRPEIGGYWGNAGYGWISQAQAAGFRTGSTPAPGAIGVRAGHVVYVESVSGNTVNISEMGWGYQANSVANYRSVPASSFTYIY